MMHEPEEQGSIIKIERSIKHLTRAYGSLMFLVLVVIYIQFKHPEIWTASEKAIPVVQEEIEVPEFENGIHVESGLKEGENLQLIIANCTSCHSAKMITQNRATREGWLHMIEWMQETQSLWELGDNEALILDYLAANYAPEKKGRRAPLMNIDWYELEN